MLTYFQVQPWGGDLYAGIQTFRETMHFTTLNRELILPSLSKNIQCDDDTNINGNLDGSPLSAEDKFLHEQSDSSEF